MKDGTRLLIEQLDTSLTESKIITEENSKDKKYHIEGIYMQSGVKNRNNREYPEPVMDREANRYIKEYIEKNRGMGELNHPSGDDPGINPERVSHKIVSLTKDGNNWIGKSVITKKTPMGALVAGLMEEGIQMGVSSRGTGTVKRQTNGHSIVQNDFHLITPADIVMDPSAPDAFVTNIMENKEWVFENGILVERDIEELQNLININTKNKKLDEELLKRVLQMVIRDKLGAKQ